MGKRIRAIRPIGCIFIGLFMGAIFSGGAQPQLSDDDVYPLISRADLYCSFFVWEGKPPDTKIKGWEREGDKLLLKDSDVIFIDKGSAQGLKEDTLFQVVELGPRLGRYGRLAFRRSMARVVLLKRNESEAVLERTCGAVRVGHYLIPFVEREGMLGKDLGYDLQVTEGDGKTGRFLHFQDDNVHLASGHWAIIDLGSRQEVKVGDQLVVCRKSSRKGDLNPFASLIVVDVQSSTSTVKVLSCKDVIRKTDLVITRPPAQPSLPRSNR